MPTLGHPASTTLPLAARYRHVRAGSVAVCEPLEPEDYQLQSMPDASPPKWHLAHSTWFFETFLLCPHAPGYRAYHPRFGHLFNSYYDAVGTRHPRPLRGLLTRPTVAEVIAYRRHVDAAVTAFLAAGDPLPEEVAAVVEIGLNHEEQHQELMLTDLKHGFSLNPLLPAYRPQPVPGDPVAPAPARWLRHAGGLVEVGARTDVGFAFDNEGPRHRVFLEPYDLASRLVTVAEYQAFIADGGYDRPEVWLSDGWAARRRHGWTCPDYWHPFDRDGDQFTLAGPRPLDPSEPVTHVSFYEADAFARWAGARLPTEAEWEVAAIDAPAPAAGWTADGLDAIHPRPVAPAADGPTQLFGAAWQWTASPYSAYPGYRPAAGALGEYNGKFMCNQMVLRGSSCATPRGHSRPTYRNFFPPEARWQFTGIRLARDV